MPERALVVEDSDVVAGALRAHLEAAGLVVDVAREAQALAALRREHAVAVIRAERLDLATTIKAKRADVQLVVLYRDDDAAAAAPAAAAAADGVLVGPLNGVSVAAAARAMVRLAGQLRRIRELERAASPRRESLELHRRMVVAEVKRARRYRYPLALALVGLDGWRESAAALGAGPQARVLADVLALLARGLRTVDLPVLHSEERFLVIMPHTPPDGALMVANRLCARVAAYPGPPKLSASAGVGCFDGQGAVSLATLLSEAQRGLDRARSEGGGRAIRGGGGRPERKVDFGW